MLSQVGHSVGIHPVETTSSKPITPIVKVSLIEKALNDQKTKGDTQSNNSLKVIRSINTAPTQNFFANQNQKFTRLIQSLFSQNNS